MSIKSIRSIARKIPSGTPWHIPPAAQTIGQTVTLTLKNGPGHPRIQFKDRSRSDLSWEVWMTAEGDDYQASIRLPDYPTIVYYQFVFPDGSTFQEKRQVEGHNQAVYGQYETRDFQIAVYDPATMPADWTQGMIIYQIFPDSFARGKETITTPRYGPYGQDLLIQEWEAIPEAPPVGRDFYGGDLPGIEQKLPYLQSLGVNCIYLCPIFAAPTNHRYDASDYMKIDPMLGTEEDFVSLIESAHQHGIRIVLDAVFNHCSCDSIYFDMPGWQETPGAYQSKESPYYRWFHFTEYPDVYDGWYGHKNMPEFVECPEVESFFLGKSGVTAYWLGKGIDGWRTDVTSCNTDTFWRRFRERVNTVKSDAYLVSEEWGDASHYMVGDMFSATMNYRFTWAVEGFFAVDKLNTSEFEDRLETLRRDTPAPALLAQMNLISSHDVRRMITACDDDQQRLRQTIAFQMSYPGAPMIYYGDEAGLEGAYAEDGRRAFPWGNEDAELMAFYKQVIQARQNNPALQNGTYETLLVQDTPRVHAFSRTLDNRTVYCIFNGSDTPVTVTLSGGENYTWQDALGIHSEVSAQNNQLTFTIQQRSMAWYHTDEI